MLGQIVQGRLERDENDEQSSEERCSLPAADGVAGPIPIAETVQVNVGGHQYEQGRQGIPVPGGEGVLSRFYTLVGMGRHDPQQLQQDQSG